MGLFDRLKKPPYNPDAPVNVPAEPVIPEIAGAAQPASPQPPIPEPELPERHEQVSDAQEEAHSAGTPGRRYVSVPEERFNLDDDSNRRDSNASA